MNIFALPCRSALLACAFRTTHASSSSSLHATAAVNSLFKRGRRTYATHQDNFDFSTSGARVSQTLDGPGKHTTADQRHDSVGPFQLGLSQQALRTGQKLPKWSELDTKGKVRRATARTTNLTVILLGAGLSALLIYSLTSELFSKNSATVLYGEACERIKTSPKVLKYLNGPLTFHNNPPTSNRPRHRNRHVTSQIVIDQHGQEHMILAFYVKGREEGSSEYSDLSYVERTEAWVKDRLASLPDMSLDDAVSWTKETAAEAWDKSIRAFKYLSGSPVHTSSSPPTTTHVKVEESEKKKTSMWDLVGVFTGLKGSSGVVSSSSAAVEDRTFTEGDVHADLVRNRDGYFVFRYLLVDIPGSRDSDRVRVFVERAPGVRDNEPVVRWVSSS
ncbi:TIM21-domain-containing protein [Coprinopsis sp. MPI-PUGE-AT-0042]|nr:TIM21-domain-containing protein [Coprinopsis sp. MPI-PUGE-AT-0042]